MSQTRRATAVYVKGVLKLQGPLPGLADGERVEVAVVRADPGAAEEAARRERALRAFNEQSRSMAAPPEPGDDYDVLEAMNATRLSQGERPLLPPGE